MKRARPSPVRRATANLASRRLVDRDQVACDRVRQGSQWPRNLPQGSLVQLLDKDADFLLSGEELTGGTTASSARSAPLTSIAM